MSKLGGFMGGLGVALVRGSLSRPKKASSVPAAPAAVKEPSALDRAGAVISDGMDQLGDGFSTAWERLKAGNIDQVGSDAYNKWGEGARIERDQTAAGEAAAQAAAGWHEDGASPTAEPLPNVSAQSAAFNDLQTPDFDFSNVA